MRVSVIGGSSVSDETYDQAVEVGRLLAEHGHTILCGGLTGVMRGVCEGANDAGGRSIGILPGENHDAANAYVDIPIATGLGHARNALVVLNGEAVIAIDGEAGTLSELGLAGVYGKPVASLGSHDVLDVRQVETPKEAVEYVESTR
ncbi:TIGR00725 family protein [Haloarchaeobius sp. HRN-SO-5]|uniref:TIGR00725 family protein n=1 Tax=Haloarchaeobius sp. HRN-SO-5 TaxID=3446118 RepID=UPI003EB9BB47